MTSYMMLSNRQIKEVNHLIITINPVLNSPTQARGKVNLAYQERYMRIKMRDRRENVS